MSQQTITITAFNRPHYFEQLLSSLVKNNLNGWMIYMQIEPSNKVEEFKAIAHALLAKDQFQIEINQTRLGVRQNPYKLLTKVFQQGSLLNIYLEEDMVVSSDLTQMATWYQMLDHTDQLCLNLMFAGCFSSGFLSTPECPSLLVKSKCFNSLGFILTKQQWQTHFASNWLRFPEFFTNINGDQVDGWDCAIYDYLLSKPELKVVSPLLARANHIGKDDGSYCTEDFHITSFDNLPIYQGESQHLDYSITDNYNTLPYAVKAHLNLWREMTQSLITLKKFITPIRKLQKKLWFVKKIMSTRLFKKIIT
ncbi:MAG: hypothetical protein WAW86_08930 [Gammaproteobacteria bacterium]